MRSAGASGQDGFTLLEFAVATVVFAVIAAVLLQRLREYQELAERADMEYHATLFRGALRVQQGILMVDGRMRENAKLLCENPVRWLQSPPANYAGIASGAGVDGVPPGHWYFDPQQCVMGYRVRHGKHFHPDSTGRLQVRYHVRAQYAEGPVVRGLVFEPVEPYIWR